VKAFAEIFLAIYHKYCLHARLLYLFETNFVDSLRCIPMQVRFKLDTCGINKTTGIDSVLNNGETGGSPLHNNR